MFCCDGERVLNYVALTVFVLSKDYLIKRYSEFVLLMLGECFLSGKEQWRDLQIQLMKQLFHLYIYIYIYHLSFLHENGRREV